MAVEIAGALGVRSPGTPTLEGTELRQFRSAWAGRVSAPVNVLVLGDSNSVGYYADTRANTWTRIMATLLSAAAGHSADEGYVTRHSLTNYLNTWTTSGSLTEFSTSGLGYAAVSPAANGGYIEVTKTCDRFWSFYTRGTLLGAHSVKIDSDPAVTVPFVSGTITGGHAFDSGPLTPGSHTIRLTSTDATFASRLEGVYFFNGNGNSSGSQGDLSAANSLTGVGPRVWNGAKFGARAGTFAATSATTWWTDGLNKVNPDLVDICFVTNEITAGTTPAQMKTDYATIVARINTVMTAASRPAPSYRFEVPHGTGASDVVFAPYRDAIIEAAVANGAALFDRYGITGYVGTSTADQWGITATLDGASRVHLSTKGHRLTAEHNAGWILAAVGLAAG